MQDLDIKCIKKTLCLSTPQFICVFDPCLSDVDEILQYISQQKVTHTNICLSHSIWEGISGVVHLANALNNSFRVIATSCTIRASRIEYIDHALLCPANELYGFFGRSLDETDVVDELNSFFTSDKIAALNYKEKFSLYSDNRSPNKHIVLVPLTAGVSLGGAIWEFTFPWDQKVLMGLEHNIQSHWHIPPADFENRRPKTLITKIQPYPLGSSYVIKESLQNFAKHTVSFLSNPSNGIMMIPIDLTVGCLETIFLLNAIIKCHRTDTVVYLLSSMGKSWLTHVCSAIEWSSNDIRNEFASEKRAFENLSSVQCVRDVEEVVTFKEKPIVVLATPVEMNYGHSLQLLMRIKNNPKCAVVFVSVPSPHSIAAKIVGNLAVSVTYGNISNLRHPKPDPPLDLNFPISPQDETPEKLTQEIQQVDLTPPVNLAVDTHRRLPSDGYGTLIPRDDTLFTPTTETPKRKHDFDLFQTVQLEQQKRSCRGHYRGVNLKPSNQAVSSEYLVQLQCAVTCFDKLSYKTDTLMLRTLIASRIRPKNLTIVKEPGCQIDFFVNYLKEILPELNLTILEQNKPNQQTRVHLLPQPGVANIKTEYLSPISFRANLDEPIFLYPVTVRALEGGENSEESVSIETAVSEAIHNNHYGVCSPDLTDVIVDLRKSLGKGSIALTRDGRILAGSYSQLQRTTTKKQTPKWRLEGSIDPVFYALRSRLQYILKGGL